MYAIVESSGRQYQLEAGRFVDIDLVGIEPGQSYVFEQVLMIVNGKDSEVGQPYVTGAKVNGRILSHDRQKKIIVYHQKPKKGTRKKQGHRQGYTRVFVDSIHLNDKVLAEAKASEKAVPQAKAKPAEKSAEKKSGKSAKAGAEKKPTAAKTPAKSAEKPAAKAPKKPQAKKAE